MKIQCPKCGSAINMPGFGHISMDKIHVTSPGSLIVCPKCGASFSQVETRAAPEWKAISILAIIAGLVLAVWVVARFLF